jgi:hypothetical protein
LHGFGREPRLDRDALAGLVALITVISASSTMPSRGTDDVPADAPAPLGL